MKKIFLFGLGILFLISCKKTETAISEKPIPLAMCAIRGPELDALNDTTNTIALLEGLGYIDFKVTTQNAEAAKYFIQGYQFANSFNHLEAARSFKHATKLDPECAMCYWGIAYVLGPNYNAPMDTAVVAVAYESIKKAESLTAKVSPVEKAIINATVVRYGPDPKADRAPLDQAYADALKKAWEQFPDDNNIGALYAESLMNLHPWDIWQKSGEPQPWTAAILTVLETILARDTNNVVANHMYIHATEASRNADKALAAANRLPLLAPNSGHLVHMPSHTYIRTGRYYEGSVANLKAILVDSAYLTMAHAGGPYPLAYFPHNYHFLTATAALSGQSELSLQAAERMARQIDTVMMRVPVLSTLQHYRYIPLYTMVKFEKWDDILNYPSPASDLLYPLCIWHYARGRAFVGKHDLVAAGEELNYLKSMENDPQLEEITIWSINPSSALVKIASRVLEANIEAHEKRYNNSIRLYREAIAIEDALKYDEPPDWFFSVRHELGLVLLESGDHQGAQKVYEEDLAIFPENGWALSGLTSSLKLQKNTSEAKAVDERFKESWQYADIKLDASGLRK